MRKQYFAAVAFGLCLCTGPVLAEHEGVSRHDNGMPFSKESIGKAVGAAAGALLGTQIGDGKGRLAAVAVGTLAGYWVGGRVGEHLSRRDQAGIAHSTQDALETGNTQTWRNPDTGVSTRVSVRDAAPERQRGRAPLQQAPTLELVNEYFMTNARINVRGGPGTDYQVLYQLAENESVPVIGKVVGENWLMLANSGEGSGFVYAPLMSRSGESGNAIRDAIRRGESFKTYSVERRECRVINQEVMLPDDTSRSHEFKACRQSDGSWTEV